MASLFNRLIMGRTKLKSVENTPQPIVGGLSTNYFTSDIMNYYRFGSYDNTFPNISRIAEAFAEVLPYAVGSDGQKLATQPQVISALYNPNKQMSGVEFFETLIVLSLVFPKVYVLCWHNKGGKAIAGGDITADNICGFTFLESPKVEVDKRTGFKTYTTRALGQESVYNENEVLEISLNVNPYSVLDGYSPSISAKKWANVDDYIADYQGGFFKNGAVPAGQFIITAGSVEEFNDIVKEMQVHHRGAGANNNVQYIHRPLGISGNPVEAQIEWKPLPQPNNQLSLQELFDQANKKIDMAFGVPQEVKGYVSNSNYASVEVADYIFARRVVYPKLVKIWSKFTHELNRITGGLGFAISFDYELPVLQEARKAQVDNFVKLLDKGYTSESIVKALQLPKSFNLLALPEENKQEEDRQDVEALNNKEDADQLITSQKSVEVSKKKLVKANSKIEKAVEDYTEKQIKTAVDRNLFDIVKESAILKGLLFGAIVEILEDNGKAQYDKGSKEIEDKGYNVDNLIGFYVPEETKRAYDEYLEQVCLSYSEETNRAINQVLERAEFEGWGKEEIRQALNDLVELEHWRVERLARTETHRAEQMANLTAMRELSQQSGAVIWKVWNINPLTPNPCEECIALNGKKLPLGDSFGEFPAGAGEVADAHPNCSCYLTFEIEDNEPVVKVVCPNCKRHLFESQRGNCKGIKCQGCKKHFDFEIKNGVVKAVEVGKVK